MSNRMTLYRQTFEDAARWLPRKQQELLSCLPDNRSRNPDPVPEGWVYFYQERPLFIADPTAPHVARLHKLRKHDQIDDLSRLERVSSALRAFTAEWSGEKVFAHDVSYGITIDSDLSDDDVSFTWEVRLKKYKGQSLTIRLHIEQGYYRWGVIRDAPVLQWSPRGGDLQEAWDSLKEAG